MAHLLLCFRSQGRDPDETGQRSLSRLPPIRLAEVNQANSSDSGVPMEPQRTVAYVELLKRKDEPLGLVLKGGADISQPIIVGQLRPGGVAQKSGALEIGDHIRAINGTATDRLNQSEANSLLCNSGNVINLEIEFDAPQGSDIDTLKKTALVRLKRERNGFGFTISGGQLESRPITVSNVIVGSFPYKNGFLKAGDRILKINSAPVTNASLSEAITLLKASEDACCLEIEYDVTIHEGLNQYRGQLMVELLKPKGASLGLTLREPTAAGGPLVVSKLKEAGIADRCGALHVGDRLLSVNKQSLEGKSISEVYRMLRRCDLMVELEIIPAHNFTHAANSDTASHRPTENSSDAVSVLSQSHESSSEAPAPPPAPSSHISATDTQSMLSFSSMATSHVVTTHPESMEVHLEADGIGFGLSLQGGATERGVIPLSISAIEEGGPAAKLGQLQVGDQVLSINGIKMAGYTLQEALKLVQEAENELDLEIMYDVRDAAPPTSGSFEVHLRKTGSLNLGITINGSVSRGDTIWIANLKKGGVAYRCGMLQPGDALLSIDSQSLEQCNIRDAADILKRSGDSVVLKVSKESAVPPAQSSPSSSSDTVIFSVVLHRNQSSLGITLTGSSDQPGHPVVISKIKENGVAHKTGALKVGNRILAINGESLYGKTLQEALHLLNNAGDTVTLKISKATRKYRHRPYRSSPTSKVRSHFPGNLYPRDSFGSSSFHNDQALPGHLPGHSQHWGSSSRYHPHYHHHNHHHHPAHRHHNRPTNAFESRQFFATPVLGESASGYNTPDNESVVSYYPPVPANFVPHGDARQVGRPGLESSGSGLPGGSLDLQGNFSPHGGKMPRMARQMPWQAPYGSPLTPRDDDQRSLSEYSQGRGRWPAQGYPQTYDHRGALESHQQQRRGTFGGPGTSLTSTKRDSSTDDEMSAYEHESEYKMASTRRTSLPEQSFYGQHPMSSASHSPRNHHTDAAGKWDFKRTAFKTNIPVGRVSPITPAETDRAADVEAQKPIKSNPKTMPLPSEGMDIEDSSSLTLSVSLPGKIEEKLAHNGGLEIEPDHMNGNATLPDTCDHHLPSSGDQDVKENGDQNEDGSVVESEEAAELDIECSVSLTSSNDRANEPSTVAPGTSRPPSQGSSTVVHESSTKIIQPDSEPSPDEEASHLDVSAVGTEACHAGSALVPSPEAMEDDYERHSPEIDEGELNYVEESIEEPLKKPRDRKLSRSSMRSADFLTTSANERSSPIAAAAHVRSFASSPPTRNNSIHRPHPQAMNPLPPLLTSSPHKYESDSRQKRRDNRHDHSPSRHSTSSPLGMKGSSFTHVRGSKIPPILTEYKNTIDKANKFQRAIAALAESGSSDQDSDSEPRGARMASSHLHPHEVAMVSEKMRAPPPIVKQQLFIRKEPGEVSFGFSIADGQFDTGVYVKTVKPSGPSERGGLLQFDKIVKVNDIQLQVEHTSSTVYALLKNMDREKLMLTVTRQAQLSL